ncbi:MAG: hypothetical protein WBM65_20355 [Sedimenticolaceae bacterium]
MPKLIPSATAFSLAAAMLVALTGTAAFIEVTAEPRLEGPISAATSTEHVGKSTPTTAAAMAPDRLQRLDELNVLSEALVEKAGSGSAPAHEFRIEARMYRELLRRTMLSDREQPVEEQLPQPLLLDMVRMSALLHSAADCKTGFVITCPADLMLQLKAQQAKVTQGLRINRLMDE